jgi:hypothetical protein
MDEGLTNMQNRSFHFEVLKKLHSMKSNKSLAELNTADRPTVDEIESLSLTCSRQLNFVEGEPESDDLTIGPESDDSTIGSANDTEFNEVKPMNAMEELTRLLQRNKELEDALTIKETAMQKLQSRNEELEKELKRKEVLRLSQLELLALRNVELEQELHRQSSAGLHPMML